MASLNKKELLLAVKRSGAVQSFARREAQAQLDVAKKSLVEEFNSNPVTQEIEGGSSASNSTNTLAGIGNLFSFIGFGAGEKPTEPVKALFNEISLGKPITSDKIRHSYNVIVPSNEQFKKATPMPWLSGRSWLFDIETGISGLSNFLTRRFLSTSRSGKAIQTDKPIRVAAYKPISYLSAILENFRRRLTS